MTSLEKYEYEASLAIECVCNLSEEKVKKEESVITLFSICPSEKKEFSYIKNLLIQYSEIRFIIHCNDSKYEDGLKSYFHSFLNRIDISQENSKSLILKSDICLRFSANILYNLYNRLEQDCFNSTPFDILESVKSSMEGAFLNKEKIYFEYLPQFIDYQYEIKAPIDILRNLYFGTLNEEEILELYTSELESEKRFEWVMNQCITNELFRKRQKQLHSLISEYFQFMGISYQHTFLNILEK